MKRALSFSLAALALVAIAALTLSLPIAPTLAQDGSTPTPQFIGGAESNENVQLALTYLETSDQTLLAPNVQYRDYTQRQGLNTSQDVLGPANYLNTVFSQQQYTLRRVLTADNTVVIEFDFTGVNTGSYQGAEPTQQSVTIPMVAIMELGTPDGSDQGSLVITRFDLYYDASQMAQALGFTLQGPQMDEEAGEGEDMTGLAPSLMVENQMIADDGTVQIARAVVSDSAWIVIHADDSGAPGEVIGYAPIAPGETLNVPVAIEGSRVTGTLWAMLHTDAGQPGVYEFPGEDVPVTDAQGNVVVVPFEVTPPAGAEQAPAEATATPMDGAEETPTATPAS